MKAYKTLALGMACLISLLAIFLPAGYAKQGKTAVYSIHVDLVYFVPKELSRDLSPKWKKTLEDAGSLLARFYELQFENNITVNVDVYPNPIIGSEETGFYNGDNTNSGNPNALLKIEEELRPKFPRDKSGADFHSLGIIYEGVGAVGSIDKQAFLVAREYLTREPIKSTYGFSILAHEFGHSLGFPDLSVGEHADFGSKIIFTSDDLMGSGRYKPLALTYLSDEIKKIVISRYEKN